MRWLKHFSDARHNPKFCAIEKRLGEAGYARAFKLFEVIAAYGGTADEFRPVLELKRPTTDLDWLANEWKISKKDATKTLDTFAQVRLIDPKLWRRKIVEVPQMLEYMDDWTKRIQRIKTPERLRSNSGATSAKEVEVEVEVEVEEKQKQKRNETPKTAAAAPIEENAKHWKAINIPPVGSPEFQEIWEGVYDNSRSPEKVSDRMERTIQLCQSRQVQVPPPFYKAKRVVEDREADAEGQLPRLVAWQDQK